MLRTHRLINIVILFALPVFLTYQFLVYELDQQYLHDYPPLEAGDIFVSKNAMSGRGTGDKLHDNIRTHTVTSLLGLGFNGRDTRPHLGNGTIQLSGHIMTGAIMFSGINFSQDALDAYIHTYIYDNKDIVQGRLRKPYLLTGGIYDTWSGISLFKDAGDLYSLGYEVVSHRIRTNKDPGYRRHNISTAFEQFGSLRILLPGDKIEFLDEINYDPSEKKLYKEGYAVVQDEEQPEYGGGLCGSSTALYQGILTNTALQLPERRAHSKRYSHLYNATINGEYITTPGIDSTIYDNHIDLKIRNISEYPVIIVSSYDGSYGGIEEVFSLATPEAQGTFSLKSKRDITSRIIKDENQIQVEGACYVWEVNNEERKSCYKEIY